jgi:hypothetical protein
MQTNATFFTQISKNYQDHPTLSLDESDNIKVFVQPKS